LLFNPVLSGLLTWHGHRVMIFGFLPENLKKQAVAVAFSMAWTGSEVEPRADGSVQARDRLAAFRGQLYGCLTARADELFELGDAVLCGDGPVRDLAGLSLVPGHRRGHGAVYDALNAGRVDVARLRWAVGCLPLPCWPDGRIRLAADVCNWLRPEARTSPERLFCHVHGRGRNAGQRIPGWPYSFVAALGPGATSWTVPLDAVRIGPDDDDTEVAAAQLREVAGRLAAAGAWRPGDGDIIVVLDSGYDVVRLAWLLPDLPVVLCARLRSNRVMYGAPPPRAPGLPGRAREHGAPVRCGDPATWTAPALTQAASTRRHGAVQVTAWNRMHPKLAKTGGWDGHPGKIPLVAGTLIQLQAGQRPGRPELAPLWLRASDPGAGPGEITVLWQAFLRRFDLEHTFRFFKQVLGWDAPRLRDPAAADRRTWLVIAAYTQLRLARPLAADLRLPWQRPQPPGTMTPARVRRGFRAVRETISTPAAPPKPGRPGPGRPKGSKNTRQATRYDVGKRHPRREKRGKHRTKTKQAG
jgi:DDE superfamily endonuclease